MIIFSKIRQRVHWYRYWRRKRQARIDALLAELEALYEEARTGPTPENYYKRVWKLQDELFILTGDPKDGHWVR
jgi:hypothetical protein